MLVGRDSPLRQIADLLRDARGGRARVAGLIGDAGAGKTALLDSAAGLADGFAVSRVAGVPAELTIGFAALGTLLSPLAHRLPQLPSRQRRAVLASLALEGADRSDAGDLLGLGAGVLTLLAEVSVGQPLLVLVDDLQWVDEESKRVLGFVARRLGGEHAAMLVAGRERRDLPHGVDHQIAVDALAADQAGELLRRRYPDLHPNVIRQLVTHCGGNSLALVESAADLDEQQRQGRSGTDLEPLVPARVRDSYRARLAALSGSTRRALLLMACEGRGELWVLARAAAAVGASSADYEQAIGAGLLSPSAGVLRFRHPLLAACVIEEAGPAACRAGHIALADVLAGVDDDRALWHRAAAADGEDAAVVGALTEFAERAVAAGLPEEASRAFERAADLTGPGPARVALLVAAAETAVQSGSNVRITALLRRAAGASAAAPDITARRGVVEARLALLRGHPERAARLLLDAAPDLDAPTREGVLILAIAAGLSLDDQRLAARALELADAAEGQTLQAVGVHREVARLLLGYLVGDPELEPSRTQTLRALVDTRPTDAPLSVLMLLGVAARQTGQLTQARDFYEHAAGMAAASGDVPGLAGAASRLAFCDFALGRWNSAYAKATEVLQLVDEEFAPALVVDALVVTADIDSARGHDARCRAACTQLRQLSETVADAYWYVLAERCEAVLDLGQQRLDSAVRRLESAAAHAAAADLRHPYVSPAPDLVEAYLRQGRREDAQRAAGPFLTRVGPGSPPPPSARALRLRAMLAPPGGYDEDFEESVRLDESAGLRFHAARTLLCHAERLRRDRRRVDARSRLLRCLDVFRSLEATPWVARAEAELLACGGTLRRSTSGSVSELLTPQELQIAVLVTEGKRNREIAAELFLSLRTVEFHLSRVFRKLEISSRTQLAARMAG